jgi:hypothetical protein
MIAAVWAFLAAVCTAVAMGFIVWTVASYIDERRYRKQREREAVDALARAEAARARARLRVVVRREEMSGEPSDVLAEYIHDTYGGVPAPAHSRRIH